MNNRDQRITLIRMAARAISRAAEAVQNTRLPPPPASAPFNGDAALLAWAEDDRGIRDDREKLEQLAESWSAWADRLAHPEEETPAP